MLLQPPPRVSINSPANQMLLPPPPRPAQQPSIGTPLMVSRGAAIRLLLAGAAALPMQALAAADVGTSTAFLPILAAQSSVKATLADEETFVTLVKLGLPLSGRLQTPPIILFGVFKQLEPLSKDPDAWAVAAVDYVENTRDADDLRALAKAAAQEVARGDTRMAAAVQDYTDRMMVAVRGSAKALEQLVPLIP